MNQLNTYKLEPKKEILYKLINIIYYALLTAIAFCFAYGLCHIALESYQNIQNNELILTNAEIKLQQMKESATTSTNDSLKSSKVNFFSNIFWVPLALSWAPAILKLVLAVLPSIAFKIPLIGQILSLIAWATTEVPQAPVDPEVIRQTLNTIEALNFKYDAIIAATQVMKETQNNEALLLNRKLEELTSELLTLKGEVSFNALRSALESSEVRPGRGVGVPIRDSSHIFEAMRSESD